MTWVRLDDGFSDHPKIRHAGPLAIAAQVRALCYCARFLTNGKIPATVVDSIFADLSPLTPGQMVLAKLWQKNGKGYIVHDYLDYNPDRKTVTEVREKRARAGQLGGVANALAHAQANALALARSSGKPPARPLTTTTTTSNSNVMPSGEDMTHDAKKAAALALLRRAGLTPPPDA